MLKPHLLTLVYYLLFCKSNNPKHELNIKENSPSWINNLDTQGYAVVPNVLSLAECDDIIDKAWEWLAAFGTGIHRNEPSTWANDRWPMNFNGIIQRYRIGHAPFIWQVRTNPNVIGVFKEIWGTGELLTSFDAMCVLRPAEMISDFEYSPSWFHTDQSPKKNGFHCVQGILNMEEVCIACAKLFPLCNGKLCIVKLFPPNKCLKQIYHQQATKVLLTTYLNDTNRFVWN